MATEMPEPEKLERPASKLAWEAPTLTLLGKVTDLVTAAKTGPQPDPDPHHDQFPAGGSGFRRPRGD